MAERVGAQYLHTVELNLFQDAVKKPLTRLETNRYSSKRTPTRNTRGSSSEMTSR